MPVGTPLDVVVRALVDKHSYWKSFLVDKWSNWKRTLLRYRKRKDGEGFEVPSGQIYRMACCDCGLVHDFVFVSNDGSPIGIAAKRNNRATAQRRKKK